MTDPTPTTAAAAPSSGTPAPRGLAETPAATVPSSGTAPGATKRGRPSVPAVLWLTLVWILLWGDLTWANLLGGVIVAYLVAAFLPLPRVPFAGRPSPVGVLRLLGHLAVDILVASVHVAWVAIRFGRPPRSGVIHVELRSRSDLYLTLTADLCSLVPGSIIVEAHRATSTLYVHVLDLQGDDAVDHARSVVLEQEARVLYALASAEEISQAGLPPRRLGGASRSGRATVPTTKEEQS
ncbi:Na+/H+ antiporter subunit E [Serinibacter arcticus]|uniref:Na+/H+ antiporter subunit E n=1 Tax=Serinibacter arcticus TaxID=1655435 RepID=A0A2U1ZVC0_9MICO|nr:Na+/H+ antiporter subunit E [Serinibacter arcticus]PWD50911.1 Na+/H+ antiporter subunit E [Serinibacter arcticus]